MAGAECSSVPTVGVCPPWKHNEERSWEYLFCGWGAADGQEPVNLCGRGRAFCLSYL